MFAHTHTEHAPWTVIKSNDKKRARLEAMRHVLSRLDYTGRREDIVGHPDPVIVVSGAHVLDDEEQEASPPRTEHPRRREPMGSPESPESVARQ